MAQDAGLTPEEAEALRAELRRLRAELTDNINRMMAATSDLTDLVVRLLRVLR